MSIRQIARLAGVSPSTVSLALQHSPRLATETRRRIVAIGKKLGYRPDPKVTALMAQLRASRVAPAMACLGVVSLYDTERPWEIRPHFRRIYEAMERRARELGYRLEPIWLRAPGMTPRRARSILLARGIQGLVSFGGPDVDEPFPRELDEFAIVTLGQSLRTHLHRVASNFFRDMWNTLERVNALGYRRPGLVLGKYDDARSGHACAGAYLGWCEHDPRHAPALQILRMDQVESEAIARWLSEQKPDVIVFAHLSDRVGELASVLAANRIRVPRDLGVAVVTQNIEGTRFSGMQQSQLLMGTRAVELVVSRIISQDFTIPVHPRIELVESEWVEGKSLRKRGRRARA